MKTAWRMVSELNEIVWKIEWKQKNYCQFEILPSNTGLKLNWRRCGSSVAPRNPIDALVAIMLIEHTIIPGIFNKERIETGSRIEILL